MAMKNTEFILCPVCKNKTRLKMREDYEDDFVKAIMGSSQQSVALDRKLKEKELASEHKKVLATRRSI